MKKIPFSIKDVKLMEVRGPWQTKSRGNLMVLFSSNEVDLKKFFKWDEIELKKTPDIRGLRIYVVKDLPKRKIGGREFHKIRQEVVFATKGAVQWTCEDLYGNTQTEVLTFQNGILIPPFVLHTYKVLIEGTELTVVANTTFDPEDSQTHDTFSAAEFREIQRLQ